MNLDELQRAWEKQLEPKGLICIDDPDTLVEQFQAKSKTFNRTIFWRDFRESAVAFVLALYIFWSYGEDSLFRAGLAAACIAFVGLFIIVDRKIQRKKQAEVGESILDNIRGALADVEHQIWLLSNLTWWYLGPLCLGTFVYMYPTLTLSPLASILIMCPLFGAVMYGVYALNQWTVRTQLNPHREELLALLDSLESQDESGDRAPERKDPAALHLGIKFIAALIALVFVAVAVFLQPTSYPKLAPYSAVRWDASTPVVQLDGTWFTLVSLDGIAVDDIVSFSQNTYGSLWKKRFEEDLVEVLAGMEHETGETVDLVVQPLDGSAPQTLEDVAMTTTNRWAIRQLAQTRGELQVTGGTVVLEKVQPYGDPVAQAVESIRASMIIPALAAFVMHDGDVVEQVVVGTRSSKDETSVDADAQWHIGGNTEAMTATLAGVLVEAGLIRWDSTIGEVLGVLAPTMDGGHRDTTLAMLLRHTSGITTTIDWWSAPAERGACTSLILSTPPAGARGSYVYSLDGYVVAGTMLEAVSGNTWEDLMREKVFEPLGMTHTGFGAPSGEHAPSGHRRGKFNWIPVAPDRPSSDNPPVMGPAATIHSTLDDYARFLAAHVSGAQGKDGIVSAETFATLHTAAEGTTSAMGWTVVERGWAGGRALMAAGTNTLWYTAAWIAPEKNAGYFAATNVGGDTGFASVNAAIEMLIGRRATRSADEGA